MWWKFWQNDKPGKLSAKASEALVSQFRLDQQVLGRLQSLEKRGSFEGRPVRYIRIFDPACIDEAHGRVQGYDDLGRYREAVLFEGRMEGKDSVFLVDRRPPSAGKKPATEPGLKVGSPSPQLGKKEEAMMSAQRPGQPFKPGQPSKPGAPSKPGSKPAPPKR